MCNLNNSSYYNIFYFKCSVKYTGYTHACKEQLTASVSHIVLRWGAIWYKAGNRAQLSINAVRVAQRWDTPLASQVSPLVGNSSSTAQQHGFAPPAPAAAAIFPWAGKEEGEHKTITVRPPGRRTFRILYGLLFGRRIYHQDKVLAISSSKA